MLSKHVSLWDVDMFFRLCFKAQLNGEFQIRDVFLQRIIGTLRSALD